MGNLYKIRLFMLRHPGTGSPPVPKQVVTSACLDEYFKRLARLNADYLEYWRLLMVAEDKLRAELFERFRRQLTKASLEGRLPMGINFDAAAPWTGVFVYAARNWEYWHDNVTKPAQDFLARGGKLMSAEKASRINVPEHVQEAVDNAMGKGAAFSKSFQGTPFQGTSRQAKKRKKERERRES